MIRYQPKQGQRSMVGEVKIESGWVLITLPKQLLVLTYSEYVNALRRGKSWKRRHALAARERPSQEKKIAPE